MVLVTCNVRCTLNVCNNSTIKVKKENRFLITLLGVYIYNIFAIVREDMHSNIVLLFRRLFDNRPINSLWSIGYIHRQFKNMSKCALS